MGPESIHDNPISPGERAAFIVIPAYNEASRLAAVLHGLSAYFPNVVVVDDGSHDATYAVASRFPVHVLRHPINRGAGAALQTGITYSLLHNARFIVTYDADGQHRPEDIERMLAPALTGEYDVVLGSRFLGQGSNPPRLRRMLLHAARGFTWLTSGLYLTDCHNGFRVLTRNAASQIQIAQDRMAHASELYDEIRRVKLKWTEVPVTIRYTADTMAKGQSNWGAVRILFQYLLGKIVQ
jgi:glycosyltransferase involved in cell wall biosynthesis